VQDADFYYLTGVSEPGAALILSPRERQYEEILYLQPRDPDTENRDGRREPLGEGLVAAVQTVRPGLREFQLQSVVDHTYKMAGAQFQGFSTILAWGPNTTVLHDTRNDQVMGDSRLVLIDRRCSLHRERRPGSSGLRQVFYP